MNLPAVFRRAAAAAVLLLACANASAQEASPAGRDRPAVAARRFMVAASHPLAVDAGYRVLREGGTVVDAGIAVQRVSNLVGPQASGIGGGTFMLFHDAKRKRLFAYDGRDERDVRGLRNRARELGAGPAGRTGETNVDGQEPEARDVCRSAPSRWRERQQRHLDGVARLGTLDVHRPHHGVHSGEVEPGDIGDRRRRGDLPAGRVLRLELDRFAVVDAEHRRQGVVPAQMALVLVKGVVAFGHAAPPIGHLARAVDGLARRGRALDHPRIGEPVNSPP